MISLNSHLVFLLCVVVATFAQNTTGFAFGLLLLGLTGLFQLISIETAANVSSLLTLFNAFLLLRRRPELEPKLIALILSFSLIGVVVGVAILWRLGAKEHDLLELMLGIAIIFCSFILLIQSRPLGRLSSSTSFCFFSALSGIMGGLFSSAGPPLVYHLYRQPLAAQVIRDALIAVFALNALLRVTLVTFSKRFDSQSLALALEAIPIVFAMTWYMRRHPPKIKKNWLRVSVFFLLLFAGGSLAFKPLMSLYSTSLSHP